MENAGRYFQLLSDVVDTLQKAVGPGYALSALGLADPLAPPGGVTDFDSSLRLSAYLQSSSSASEDSLRKITLRAIDQGHRFLEQRRQERLRQARITFNAAITLVLVGTGIILLGVLLLFLRRATEGGLSAGVGAVSNIASALLFRLNRDANDRLDKIAVHVGALEGARRTLARLDPQRDHDDS